MIALRITLSIFLGLSIFLPIYTYFVYPFVLKLFKDKKYVSGNITPHVNAIICFGSGDNNKKIENVKKSAYKNLNVVASSDANLVISNTKGEITLFLDNETELEEKAISEIVKPFNDKRVDMVVGEQTCIEGNSAFWKYETKIRELESKIGSVSGANKTLFAVRTDKLFPIPPNIKNLPFYISTKIKQNKGAIVYCSKAKTFETKQNSKSFKNMIYEASGFWQSFFVFWALLFPRNGSFVYLSHRVFKWFLWLNALLANVCLFLLFPYLPLIISILASEIAFCLFLLLPSNLTRYGVFRLARYFLLMNIAYFVGIFIRQKT